MPPAPIDTVLDALARQQPVDLPVAIVVAHPDDETIGAGGCLRLFRQLTIVHVTDGAPRSLTDARAAGFGTHAAYARARRQELASALAAGEVCARCRSLPVADQGAAFALAALPGLLAPLLADAAVVLTHAYEGGHPDHDATAWAVHVLGFPAIEMAGYHAGPDGGLITGRFLPGGDPGLCVTLDTAAQARREAMLGLFATQSATLAPFRGMAQERFRAAPCYDFTRAPAPRCYYDGFDWGMTSARFCALAAAC